MTKPLVTVCVITYNHARYVRQAMDSFLMQETDFPYEIFVHDDASTDDTQAILMEYRDRYPDRVHLLLQTENQYSKNDKIMARFMFPVIDTEYIAFCEGDDFWTDPKKLQKQIGWLMDHPDYSLSVTNADTVNSDGIKNGAAAPYSEDCDMPMEDLIRGGGGFITTASIATRVSYLKDLPEYYYRAKVGDAPLQLYLASLGKTRWHADHTCAYRVNAVGSWTVAQLMEDVSKPIAMHESMLDMLAGFDEATGGRYEAPLTYARNYHTFQIARLKGDFRTMKRPEHAKMYATLSWRVKLRTVMMKYCPFVIRLYRKIKLRRGF